MAIFLILVLLFLFGGAGVFFKILSLPVILFGIAVFVLLVLAFNSNSQ